VNVCVRLSTPAATSGLYFTTTMSTTVTTTQTQDHGLLFLSNHSLDEAKHFGLDVQKYTLSHDPEASITVTGSEVVVKYNPEVAAGVLSRTQTFTSKPPYTYYTLQIPNTTRKGHLYFRGEPPASGDSEFWIQQYPPYFGGDGRLVVEFWTDSSITAVFKTDDNNFGAAGKGSWD